MNSPSVRSGWHQRALRQLHPVDDGGVQPRLQRSKAAVDKALVLQPNDAAAIESRGIFLIFTGEPAKGIEDIERSMQLDPDSRRLALHFIGLAHLLLRNYQAVPAQHRPPRGVPPGRSPTSSSPMRPTACVPRPAHPAGRRAPLHLVSHPGAGQLERPEGTRSSQGDRGAGARGHPEQQRRYPPRADRGPCVLELPSIGAGGLERGAFG